MEAIRIQQIIEKKGELTIRNLPVEAGQEVEVLLLFSRSDSPEVPGITARELLNSEVIGLWNDRDDIPDSPEYARELRESAQRRSGINGIADDNRGH